MKKIVTALARRYSSTAIVALQEVPQWGLYRSQFLSVRSAVGCDCAIVIPNHLVKDIKWEVHAKYWCLVLLPDRVVVSAHILDYHEESSDKLDAVSDAIIGPSRQPVARRQDRGRMSVA